MTLKPGLTIMKTIKELQDFYDDNLSNREFLKVVVSSENLRLGGDNQN